MKLEAALGKTLRTVLCLGAAVLAGAAGAENNGAPIPLELTLEDAKRIALEANPSVAAARERIIQAESRVTQARSAYFPTVDASAGYNQTRLPSSDVDAARQAATLGPFQGLGQRLPQQIQIAQQRGTPLLTTLATQAGSAGFQAWRGRRDVEDRFSEYNAALSARWVIFDGFGREYAHSAARTAARESRAAFQDVRRQLLSAVAQSYYFAQLAREDIVIADADLAFNERLLEEAKARQEAGTGPLSDVLTFEVRLNASRSARLRAVQDYRMALVALAELMGFGAGSYPEGFRLADLPAPPEAAMADLDPGELFSAALEGRPDLRRERLAVERARTNTGQQRADFLPTVSARLSYNANRESSSISSRDFATNIGVEVSYNIFSGGRNRAQLQEARAAEREAQLNARGAELDITAEIDERVEELRTAREELRIQEANAGLVERNRDLVERGFLAGQESLVRLTEAQRDLVEARGRHAFAQVSVLQAWQNLQAATGAILEDTPALD